MRSNFIYLSLNLSCYKKAVQHAKETRFLDATIFCFPHRPWSLTFLAVLRLSCFKFQAFCSKTTHDILNNCLTFICTDMFCVFLCIFCSSGWLFLTCKCLNGGMPTWIYIWSRSGIQAHVCEGYATHIQIFHWTIFVPAWWIKPNYAGAFLLLFFTTVIHMWAFHFTVL